ncbi:hypothetical protein BH24CHL3_BH24CHL3_03740 [soil metagenome]
MAVPEDLIRKMAAEAIGTFILVLAGAGAVILGSSYPLAFGFALIAIVYAIGHISGAHVNPAVTIGLAAIGRFPMPHVPYYIGSQVAGAVLAALFLRLIYGSEGGLGATSVAEGFSNLDGFLLELVATAVFVFVFAAVATDKRVPAGAFGLAAGGALLFIALFAGPFTGASVNPARSLGPALASWTFTDLWIYLTAPFIGAVIGAVAYEFVRGPEGWAEDRPGPEQAPPGEQRRQRPQQQQRRRQPGLVDGDIEERPQQRRRQPGMVDGNIEERPRRPRQPTPQPEYDQDPPPPYDEEPPPTRPAQRAQQQRTREQRPLRQPAPEFDPNDPNAPPRPPRQRRPPQE